MEKKIEKMIFVFMITRIEQGTANSRNPEKDTCNWQSMC